jgi:membrane-associated protease RseP (regulator of RpoE activity)
MLATLLVAALGGLLAFVSQIVLHELAHYFTAISLGLRVTELSIGRGKPFLEWYIGVSELKLSIRRIPISIGMTYDIEQVFKQNRLKRMAVNFAGPAINILPMLLVYYNRGKIGQFLPDSWELITVMVKLTIGQAGIFEYLQLMAKFPATMLNFMGAFHILGFIMGVTALIPLPPHDGASIILDGIFGGKCLGLRVIINIFGTIIGLVLCGLLIANFSYSLSTMLK